MTVLDLITKAYFDLGVLQAGETPSAEDAALGLSTFNDWIDALKTEGLTVYTITRTTWTLTPSTASFTVGTGGNVAIARPLGPEDISNIGWIDNSLTTPLERMFGVVLTEAAYQLIPQKTLTSSYPTQFYYNPTFPLGALKPFPIPTASSLLGVIYAPAPVDEFAAVSTTVSVPPGYRRFYRTNLAVELAAALGTSVPPTLAAAATDSKANVKRSTRRLSDMGMDLGALISRRAGYDINVGP